MMGKRWFNLAVLWFTYEINYLDRIAVLIFLPVIRTDLGLTHAQAGVAASMFFFMYALSQLFLGGFADRFRVTNLIKVAIGIFSCATLFMGLMRNHLQFVLLRGILGFGEAIHIPPMFRSIANWFPSHEKARALSIMTLAWTVGPAFLPAILVWISVMMGGWRQTFAGLFIVGLIAITVVHFFIQDDPETAHQKKRLSDEEYNLIKSGLLEIGQTAKRVLTIKEQSRIALTQGSFWVYCFIWFFNLSLGWGILAWMPSFLVEQHGLNLKQMGLAAAIPWACAAMGQMLGGWMYDKITYFQTRVRLLLTGAFLLMVPVLYVLYSQQNTNIPVVLVCLSIVVAAVHYCQPVLYAYFQKRYPKETIGFTTGMSNGIGQFGGFVTPILMGILVVKTAGGIQYGQAFGLLIGFALCGSVLSMFLSEKKVDFTGILGNMEEKKLQVSGVID